MKNNGYKVFLEEVNRKSPVSVKELEKLAYRTFQVTGKKGGDVSLVVCDDEFISGLNEKYLGRKGPTNVLSFQMIDEYSTPVEMDNLPLGDIIISVDTTKRQTVDFGEPFERLFKRFFVHGLLHLLGFEHNNIEDEEEMNLITDKILMEV